jgi:hypothetical protein
VSVQCRASAQTNAVHSVISNLYSTFCCDMVLGDLENSFFGKVGHFNTY